MADDKNAGAGFLGVALQLGGAFLDLGDAAGRGIDCTGLQGLDGVCHQDFRLQLGSLGKYVVQAGLGQDVARTLGQPQTVGPHLELFGAFFPAYVENLMFSGHLQGYLQHQSGLADSRFAAYQNERTRYKASA